MTKPKSAGALVEVLFKGGQPVKRIVGAKNKAALLRELSDAVPNVS
jgi:thioredoxin 1